MTTLLLRLGGPLQSWGDSSRFTRRATRPEPTKSGVLGLLAAAQGRRRTDPVEDLALLRFGVRVDQAGELERDFHTVRSRDGAVTMPLSTRYYLADAVFVAAVEGEHELLTGLDEAVRSPAFSLFLGRRSCPPAGPVSLGLREEGLEQALRREPWHASSRIRARSAGRSVALRLLRDADPDESGVPVKDVPVSFDPERRQHTWRQVVEVEPVVFGAMPRDQRSTDPHDALGALDGMPCT